VGSNQGVPFKCSKRVQRLAVTIDQDCLVPVSTDLLINAIKLSPRSGLVALILAKHEDFAPLSIRDQGAAFRRDCSHARFSA